MTCSVYCTGFILATEPILLFPFDAVIAVKDNTALFEGCAAKLKYAKSLNTTFP